ncbi:hypothetical protein D3273_22930 [Lichenibacterium minor]|uniref:Uncharacterized protein n=1 Tax=Lichenibacterium minor TaxID=2316528 RepID=A0A4Q2U1T3_9HYPH|nr:hypothetical protein [Lichenibacterium minor]RYC29668.1 hypothetical protein D3273_22930 [Lichenibacterium minor]
MSAAQRARLVAGLEPWASARPQYRLKLRSSPIPFDVLSDEALRELRGRIAHDVRRERHRRAA